MLASLLPVVEEGPDGARVVTHRTRDAEALGDEGGCMDCDEDTDDEAMQQEDEDDEEIPEADIKLANASIENQIMWAHTVPPPISAPPPPPRAVAQTNDCAGCPRRGVLATLSRGGVSTREL